MKIPSIIQYKYFNADNIPSAIENDSSEMKHFLGRNIQKINNEPIVIIGGKQCPLFLGVLLIQLRSLSTAISYQYTSQNEAYVIYSRIDPELYFQPYNFVDLTLDTDPKPLPIAHAKAIEYGNSTININLDYLWDKNWKFDDQNAIKKFANQIKNLKINNKNVQIKGTTLILPYLMLINHCSEFCSELYYNSHKLI